MELAVRPNSPLENPCPGPFPSPRSATLCWSHGLLGQQRDGHGNGSGYASRSYLPGRAERFSRQVQGPTEGCLVLSLATHARGQIDTLADRLGRAGMVAWKFTYCTVRDVIRRFPSLALHKWPGQEWRADGRKSSHDGN